MLRTPSRLVAVLLSTALFTSGGCSTPARAPSRAVAQEAASADFRTAGHFTEATARAHRSIIEGYLKSGATRDIQGKTERFEKKDLIVDLADATPARLAELRKQGREKMPEVYYLTSGAGLWSRGAGQVKALIPFNLKESLSADDFEKLLDPAYAAGNREAIGKIIQAASRGPHALNPLDLKFANAALASQRAGTYVPFDIWTSEQTHQSIAEYLDWLKQGYRTKVFHADSAVNARIQGALGDYFEQSAQRGETHLFGYQVGYHAFDPQTGEPIAEAPAIGEGAGMFLPYLKESGRARELARDKKGIFIFENIEVVSPLEELVGSYAELEKRGFTLGAVQVPQRDGYKGGSPFVSVAADGERTLKLYEGSSLPKQFAEGNRYFNTNTLIGKIGADDAGNSAQGVGYEEKDSAGRKIVRVKANAGDLTFSRPTGGIGGRIGREYENFKSFAEFGQNGAKLILTQQAAWASDLAAAGSH